MKIKFRMKGEFKVTPETAGELEFIQDVDGLTAGALFNHVYDSHFRFGLPTPGPDGEIIQTGVFTGKLEAFLEDVRPSWNILALEVMEKAAVLDEDIDIGKINWALGFSAPGHWLVWTLDLAIKAGADVSSLDWDISRRVRDALACAHLLVPGLEATCTGLDGTSFIIAPHLPGCEADTRWTVRFPGKDFYAPIYGEALVLAHVNALSDAVERSVHYATANDLVVCKS